MAITQAHVSVRKTGASAAVAGGLAASVLAGGIGIVSFAAGRPLPIRAMTFAGLTSAAGAAASAVAENSFHRESHDHGVSGLSLGSGALIGGIVGAVVLPLVHGNRSTPTAMLGLLGGALFGTLSSPAGIIAANFGRD